MRSFKDIVQIPDPNDSGAVCQARVFNRPEDAVRFLSQPSKKEKQARVTVSQRRQEHDAALDTILMESLWEGFQSVDHLFGEDGWTALSKMARKLRPHVHVCKTAHSTHGTKGGEDDWDWDNDYGWP